MSVTSTLNGGIDSIDHNGSNQKIQTSLERLKTHRKLSQEVSWRRALAKKLVVIPLVYQKSHTPQQSPFEETLNETWYPHLPTTAAPCLPLVFLPMEAIRPVVGK